MINIKLAISLLLFIFLTGCGGIAGQMYDKMTEGTYKNPYDDLSSNQLKLIPNQTLCEVIRNPKYKPNKNVYKEMMNRKLVDCSVAEAYCRDSGLKFGSPQFASCKLQMTQTMINESVAYSQIEAQSRPQTIIIRHNQPLGSYL